MRCMLVPLIGPFHIPVRVGPLKILNALAPCSIIEFSTSERTLATYARKQFKRRISSGRNTVVRNSARGDSWGDCRRPRQLGERKTLLRRARVIFGANFRHVLENAFDWWTHEGPECREFFGSRWSVWSRWGSSSHCGAISAHAQESARRLRFQSLRPIFRSTTTCRSPKRTDCHRPISISPRRDLPTRFRMLLRQSRTLLQYPILRLLPEWANVEWANVAISSLNPQPMRMIWQLGIGTPGPK